MSGQAIRVPAGLTTEGLLVKRYFARVIDSFLLVSVAFAATFAATLLLPDSYGGKLHPRAVPELLSSLPTVTTALARGKMSPLTPLRHPHKAPKEVKKIFDTIEGREQRVELNIYISGEEEDELRHAPHTDIATPLHPQPRESESS